MNREGFSDTVTKCWGGVYRQSRIVTPDVRVFIRVWMDYLSGWWPYNQCINTCILGVYKFVPTWMDDFDKEYIRNAQNNTEHESFRK